VCAKLENMVLHIGLSHS